MAWLPLIALALIQGLTEFLPISSSGHLLLVHRLSGEATWQSHVVLDVAVHVGTLFSVLLYFRKDVAAMASGVKGIATGQIKNPGAQLIFKIILASIPVVIAGLMLHLSRPDWLLSLNLVALTTLFFGILLWIADQRPETSKTLEQMKFKEAILIGLAQSLALIPGTSRSGITMTTARFLGYSRTESAHFSLLLAIVAISGAGIMGGLELIKSDNAGLSIEALIAALFAFVTGWASIALMMKWLEKSSFTPFVIYRVLLGLLLLGLLNFEWLYALIS